MTRNSEVQFKSLDSTRIKAIFDVRVNGHHFVLPAFYTDISYCPQDVSLSLVSRHQVTVLLLDELETTGKFVISNPCGDVFVLQSCITSLSVGHKIDVKGRVFEVGKCIASTSPIKVDAPKGHVKMPHAKEIASAVQKLLTQITRERFLGGLAALFHAVHASDLTNRKMYPVREMLAFFDIPQQPPAAAK